MDEISVIPALSRNPVRRVCGEKESFVIKDLITLDPGSSPG
jgi:hypothetical protein